MNESAPRPLPYRSAQALGAALTARFKALAAGSPYSVSQLRRQFAYDRLLARLFSEADDRWIIKGGVSMLARLSIARHSADVDLLARADSPENALSALRHAAHRNLGDFFGFRFDAPRAMVQGVQGLRIPVEARLGQRLFERFGVDLVTGAVITGEPDTAAPIIAIDIPGLVQPSYRLYPLADSLADKVMAITELHDGRPSTRFRDLVDIVLIAHDQPVDADALTAALASERLRRDLVHPRRLDVPDSPAWRRGYARLASDVPRLAERTLDDALDTARTFLDPVLSGRRTRGTWDPTRLTWT